MKWFIKWLRKPRWRTRSTERADRSPFQWRFVPYRDEYTLSILGVINGVLPVIGLVLLDVNEERLTITKVWW